MKTREIIKTVVGLATGSSMTFFYVSKEEKKRQEIFKSLPIEKQREIYNRSPLNKKGYLHKDLSAIAAIEQRIASSNPSITRLPPEKPFKPR